MKVVLDTNVLVSGIFYSGPPFEILKAWRDGKLQLAMSAEILKEYQRVMDELARQFPGVDASEFIDLLMVEAEIALAPPLPKPVCSDPDDDKFLACAVASAAKYVVTGDKKLLMVSKYRNVEIVKPRWFVDAHLRS